MSERTLERELAQLLEAQLLVPESSGRFAFRHALTHEAVYSTLLVRERKRVHHVVAECLERLHTESLNSLAGELAHHYFEAGTWDKALHYAARAGDNAQKLFAPREAIGFYTQALVAAQNLAGIQGSQGQLPELYHARGQAHETLGEFTAAQRDYELSLQHARQQGIQRAEWQALLDLGFLWAARDYGQTGDYFRAALELARTLDDRSILAHTLNRVGNWYTNTGQQDLSLEAHREALVIFETLAEQPGIAETLDLLALTNFQRGDWIESARNYERAIVLFRKLGDRRGLSSALATYAERAAFPSEVIGTPVATIAQATHEADEALHLARSIGWRAGEAYALTIRAMLAGSAGDFGLAFALHAAAEQITMDIEHRQWQAFTSGVKGFLYRDLLAFDEAINCLTHGLAVAREIGSLVFVPLIGIQLAWTYAAQQDWESVMRILNDIAPSEYSSSNSASRLTALNLFERWRLALDAHSVLARGDPQGTLDTVKQLFIAGQINGDSISPARLVMLQAEALLQLEATTAQLAEAHRMLETSRDETLMRGAWPSLWAIYTTLGKLSSALSLPQRARTEFAQARSTVQQVASAIPSIALREQFARRAEAFVSLAEQTHTKDNTSQ